MEDSLFPELSFSGVDEISLMGMPNVTMLYRMCYEPNMQN